MDLVRWICVWYPCAMNLSEVPFLCGLLEWARCQDGLAAVILTGSRARKHATIDAASDYDVEIFLAEPARYGLSSEWLEEISPVWVYIDPSKDNAGEGNEEVPRLVFFSRGTKADLRIRSTKALTELADGGLDDLYDRGYVVLADPSGLASRLPAPSGHSPRIRPPTNADLLDVCSEFWFEAAHIPGLLARDELWVVKFREGTMKSMLLRLIEWDALARLGPKVDVWHVGPHMRDWARRTSGQTCIAATVASTSKTPLLPSRSPSICSPSYPDGWLRGSISAIRPASKTRYARTSWQSTTSSVVGSTRV